MYAKAPNKIIGVGGGSNMSIFLHISASGKNEYLPVKCIVLLIRR